MAKRSKSNVEFDRMRGKVQMEIANLYREYPLPIVRMAMMEELSRHFKESSREEFREEYYDG